MHKLLKNPNDTETQLDPKDHFIVRLPVRGYNAKSISETTKTPLSTIQRRIRKLYHRGIINLQTGVNYSSLGYKRGLLMVNLSKGEASKVGNTISKKLVC